MSERLGGYDPGVEKLISDMEAINKGVKETLSSSKGQNRVTNGETAPSDEKPKATKRRVALLNTTTNKKEQSSRRR